MIVIAVLFSLIYLLLYPILTDKFIFYLYPSFSEFAAIIYIIGGVLIQFLFFFLKSRFRMRGLPFFQIIVGILYVLVVGFFGSVYMS